MTLPLFLSLSLSLSLSPSLCAKGWLCATSPHDSPFMVVYQQRSLLARLMSGSVVKKYFTSTAHEDNGQRTATFAWGGLVRKGRLRFAWGGLVCKPEIRSLSSQLVSQPSNPTMTGHVSCCFDSYQLNCATEHSLHCYLLIPQATALKTKCLFAWAETANLIHTNQ